MFAARIGARLASRCATQRVVAQRVGAHVARGGAVRALSGSHSDFETTQRRLVPTDEEGIKKMIGEQVTENKVMLYMKGTPEAPQCGFSQQVVRILHATGVKFSSVNVLEDVAIREGVKAFSEWPTVPQLYVGGEFVGGCDIVTSLFQSGELDEALKKSGALP
ncbi:thioredoxin-like protein [Pelagophyceae sp. CCMP2097]|nr:thioredoxin-like protein [Pelagophyceae sp. CCMP2097]|eukprot:CAMPEP_0184129418 /NCGR_PEP_ID=MMETSP0974-20121125/27075_1 /TAXON_ID=483370 /ORGANISM="non described non described, Strain CCMP2097" /LENGTH=162 /DNA_ID=CAMNT_0026432851 /DNA_START=79 /DNA_END=567 /DNA_ORIENTATION=+